MGDAATENFDATVQTDATGAGWSHIAAAPERVTVQNPPTSEGAPVAGTAVTEAVEGQPELTCVRVTGATANTSLIVRVSVAPEVAAETDPPSAPTGGEQTAPSAPEGETRVEPTATDAAEQASVDAAVNSDVVADPSEPQETERAVTIEPEGAQVGDAATVTEATPGAEPPSVETGVIHRPDELVPLTLVGATREFIEQASREFTGPVNVCLQEHDGKYEIVLQTLSPEQAEKELHPLQTLGETVKCPVCQFEFAPGEPHPADA